MSDIRTVWREKVAVINSYAQNVLLQILDGELHGSIPLRIQRVLYDLGLVFLSSHADLAVGIALACNGREQLTIVESML